MTNNNLQPLATQIWIIDYLFPWFKTTCAHQHVIQGVGIKLLNLDPSH